VLASYSYAERRLAGLELSTLSLAIPRARLVDILAADVAFRVDPYGGDAGCGVKVVREGFVASWLCSCQSSEKPICGSDIKLKSDQSRRHPGLAGGEG
jgi:hypothetical protein